MVIFVSTVKKVTQALTVPLSLMISLLAKSESVLTEMAKRKDKHVATPRPTQSPTTD